MTNSPNPLLQPHALPPFATISPDHVVPAVEALTSANLSELQELLEQTQEPTWHNLVWPLEDREDRLNQAWSPVTHLNGVANNPELREAYNQSINMLTEYNTRMGQNSALYSAYKRLAESADYTRLSPAQQRSIQNALRDFRLAGVDLPEAQKKRYGEIQTRLSDLTNRFSNHVLDATQGWNKHITDATQLAGLPESALAGAAQVAKIRG